MARSLNRVQLIGNLTRDPELRYTPNGNAVCTFSIATNRSWTTDSGEKREEVDFHRIVAWNKLGELCSQFLVKGRKVYVEGRLSTRNWTGQDGTQKTTTEVVIDDMILLDSKGAGSHSDESREAPARAVSQEAEEQVEESEEKPAKSSKKKAEKEEKPAASNEEDVMPDDIPF
jgi:single-strand DNA-binding protein